MELVELHVLQRQPPPPDDAHPVAGERVRVRRRAEHLAEPTGREDHCLGPEDLHLSGRQLVRDDSGRPPVDEDQIEDVELVEELDPVFDALLVEGLQNHVAGAVGRETRPTYRGLSVVAGMPTESPLVDPAIRGPVEGQAHLLQVEDSVDGFTAHDLGGVLVDQVVPTLHSVECVPFPVVVLDIRERCAHTALGCTGVGARRVQLGEDSSACAASGLQSSAHPGAAGPDDDHVVLMRLHDPDSLRSAEGRQQLGGLAGWTRVEGEDDQRAEQDRGY